ncbi:MAG TPA: hypothetical protein VNL14_06575 [Candidatus Acidoferrales bacterium]|nr:hypothetical protein [Candidatus Acidoferrales bacterium]
MKGLRAEIVPATRVLTRHEERLYRLYASCYDGTDPARFRADLEEKQWVILLFEERGEVVGFSTQLLMDTNINERPVHALFSGDTVIHPRYWGSLELVRAWCRLAGTVKAQNGGRPLYWFLISKGHRTYLYLPSFFNDFYPRYDRPTPLFEAQLINTLGAAKFPREFNPGSGLIEYGSAHDRLKSELDAAPKRLNNPHVDFFVRKNPNYGFGSELVCVAEISPANMRSVARRELEIGMKAALPLVA